MNQKEVIKPIKKLALLPLTDGENGYFVADISEDAGLEVIEWASYAAQEKVQAMGEFKAPSVIRAPMEKLWEISEDGIDPSEVLIGKGFIKANDDKLSLIHI